MVYKTKNENDLPGVQDQGGKHGDNKVGPGMGRQEATP
jgi:hypothetical protein